MEGGRAVHTGRDTYTPAAAASLAAEATRLGLRTGEWRCLSPPLDADEQAQHDSPRAHAGVLFLSPGAPGLEGCAAPPALVARRVDAGNPAEVSAPYDFGVFAGEHVPPYMPLCGYGGAVATCAEAGAAQRAAFLPGGGGKALRFLADAELGDAPPCAAAAASPLNADYAAVITVNGAPDDGSGPCACFGALINDCGVPPGGRYAERVANAKLSWLICRCACHPHAHLHGVIHALEAGIERGAEVLLSYGPGYAKALPGLELEEKNYQRWKAVAERGLRWSTRRGAAAAARAVATCAALSGGSAGGSSASDSDEASEEERAPSPAGRAGAACAAPLWGLRVPLFRDAAAASDEATTACACVTEGPKEEAALRADGVRDCVRPGAPPCRRGRCRALSGRRGRGRQHRRRR